MIRPTVFALGGLNVACYLLHIKIAMESITKYVEEKVSEMQGLMPARLIRKLLTSLTLFLTLNIACFS